MNKRVNHFSYYAELQSNDISLVHKLRDGHAFVQVMDVLRDRGYQLGDLIINSKDAPPGAYADYGFEPDDLIVITTRAPLSDFHERRRIPPTGTSLEGLLLDVMAQFVSRFTVDHVVVQKNVSDCFVKPAFKGRSEFTFWTTADPRHMRSGCKALGQNHTLAYLLFIESEAWPGGPGVLWSFAQGGPYTLVWNYWLRTRPKLHDLLRRPGSRFVLADIDVCRPATSEWTDLTPSDEWPVDVEEVDLLFTGGQWTPIKKRAR